MHAAGDIPTRQSRNVRQWMAARPSHRGLMVAYRPNRQRNPIPDRLDAVASIQIIESGRFQSVHLPAFLDLALVW